MLVVARTPLFATESEEKVIRAVLNVLGFKREDCFIEGIRQYREVVCRTESHKPLEKLASLVRSQRILDAARSYVLKEATSNTFKFYLNKQAAYQGRVSFCTFEYGESPLGSITVYIDIGECDRELFLNWLVPETRDGHPVNEETHFRCIG
ncbi:hypothetical protein IG193_03985 [Infirmifilum lucidum]|uniref:UPF0201 protein IG193_03985 n=1 Tax=Infirmifilum lucidum TaxID=2776706 RepID=A0A7L9FKZ8_9CREN|nr:RNA-binding domain-containing protein [Infirmifilum lucidum]QOJ79624.1 hypothetical protein IG193_03985 [Infirmifilum lucidum]